MKVDVFDFIIRLSFDVWRSKFSTICSHSPFHDERRFLRKVIFDNFSRQLDAVADILTLIESVRIYTIIPRIFLFFLNFVSGVALCLFLHFPH